jgi:hypothetical protein
MEIISIIQQMEMEYTVDGDYIEYTTDGNYIEYTVDGDYIEYTVDGDYIEYTVDGDYMGNTMDEDCTEYAMYEIRSTQRTMGVQAHFDRTDSRANKYCKTRIRAVLQPMLKTQNIGTSRQGFNFSRTTNTTESIK